MNRETLFTFVFDYGGGTYISQISGLSLTKAIAEWANSRTDRDLTTWRLARQQLSELVKCDTPVALEGCQNVWCLTNSSEDSLMLLNIIATQPDQASVYDAGQVARTSRRG
jgi:hypothetical protein